MSARTQARAAGCPARPMRGRVPAACVAIAMAVTIAPAHATACEARDLAFGRTASGWAPQSFSRLKRDTTYTVVREDGRAVLRATADRAASLYVAKLDRPISAPRSIEWRWSTSGPVPGADNRERSREDAPLRVIVAFDGDPATLPDAERKRFERARKLSGRTPPFATLMYVWTDTVPVDTVIPSAHTGRLQMMVAAPAAAAVGAWQTVRRDLAADYRAAFGTEPGRVLAVGVMTDTDNTGTKAEGRYADLRLGCAAD
jgi:hypothetical protein